MALTQHWFYTRHGNVWIYIPNLIGYARIASTLTAFLLAPQYPSVFVILYFLGFVADETDGRLARKYKQTSTLGAVLDMVTDRASTAGLLMLLCKTYPNIFILFLSLLMLDLFSHWFQMYSTLVAGSATHKCFLHSQPRYQSLGLLPVPLPHQLARLLPGMQEDGQIPAVAMLALTALPGVLTKQFVNCVQLKNAMASLIAHDQQMGDTVTLPKLD
ncbi:MAG: hypothetical protein FRX49_06765 [Trebouxia sp. A1-2]|nr:MAG: hypothetical protein FRX49_06765 [Trebouxia sp. A1-2]